MKARLVAALAAASLVLVGVTGCTFMTPQATTEDYSPSDGFDAQVGDVLIRNAMIVTDDGQLGSLVVAFVNRGDSGANVQIQYTDAAGAKQTKSVSVGADGAVQLGVDELLVLSGIDAAPGSLFPMFFQYGTQTGVQLSVPVLDGKLPEYKTLLPTLPAPAPEPTAEADEASGETAADED